MCGFRLTASIFLYRIFPMLLVMAATSGLSYSFYRGIVYSDLKLRTAPKDTIQGETVTAYEPFFNIQVDHHPLYFALFSRWMVRVEWKNGTFVEHPYRHHVINQDYFNFYYALEQALAESYLAPYLTCFQAYPNVPSLAYKELLGPGNHSTLIKLDANLTGPLASGRMLTWMENFAESYRSEHPSFDEKLEVHVTGVGAMTRDLGIETLWDLIYLTIIGVVTSTVATACMVLVAEHQALGFVRLVDIPEEDAAGAGALLTKQVLHHHRRQMQRSQDRDGNVSPVRIRFIDAVRAFKNRLRVFLTAMAATFFCGFAFPTSCGIATLFAMSYNMSISSFTAIVTALTITPQMLLYNALFLGTFAHKLCTGEWRQYIQSANGDWDASEGADYRSVEDDGVGITPRARDYTTDVSEKKPRTLRANRASTESLDKQRRGGGHVRRDSQGSSGSSFGDKNIYSYGLSVDHNTGSNHVTPRYGAGDERTELVQPSSSSKDQKHQGGRPGSDPTSHGYGTSVGLGGDQTPRPPARPLAGGRTTEDPETLTRKKFFIAVWRCARDVLLFDLRPVLCLGFLTSCLCLGAVALTQVECVGSAAMAALVCVGTATIAMAFSLPLCNTFVMLAFDSPEKTNRNHVVHIIETSVAPDATDLRASAGDNRGWLTDRSRTSSQAAADVRGGAGVDTGSQGGDSVQSILQQRESQVMRLVRRVFTKLSILGRRWRLSVINNQNHPALLSLFSLGVVAVVVVVAILCITLCANAQGNVAFFNEVPRNSRHVNYGHQLLDAVGTSTAGPYYLVFKSWHTGGIMHQKFWDDVVTSMYIAAERTNIPVKNATCVADLALNLTTPWVMELLLALPFPIVDNPFKYLWEITVDPTKTMVQCSLAPPFDPFGQDGAVVAQHRFDEVVRDLRKMFPGTFGFVGWYGGNAANWATMLVALPRLREFLIIGVVLLCVVLFLACALAEFPLTWGLLSKTSASPFENDDSEYFTRDQHNLYSTSSTSFGRSNGSAALNATTTTPGNSTGMFTMTRKEFRQQQLLQQQGHHHNNPSGRIGGGDSGTNTPRRQQRQQQSLPFIPHQPNNRPKRGGLLYAFRTRFPSIVTASCAALCMSINCLFCMLVGCAVTIYVFQHTREGSSLAKSFPFLPSVGGVTWMVFPVTLGVGLSVTFLFEIIGWWCVPPLVCWDTEQENLRAEMAEYMNEFDPHAASRSATALLQRDVNGSLVGTNGNSIVAAESLVEHHLATTVLPPTAVVANANAKPADGPVNPYAPPGEKTRGRSSSPNGAATRTLGGEAMSSSKPQTPTGVGRNLLIWAPADDDATAGDGPTTIHAAQERHGDSRNRNNTIREDLNARAGRAFPWTRLASTTTLVPILTFMWIVAYSSLLWANTTMINEIGLVLTSALVVQLFFVWPMLRLVQLRVIRIVVQHLCCRC